MSSIVTTQLVQDALHRALLAMDAEATTKYLDAKVPGATWTAGLRQYHEHYNPLHGSRIGCEPSWTQRLRDLLNRAGVRAEAEVEYPAYAVPADMDEQWCDLRVQTEEGPMWVEVKGSWPVCFEARPGGGVRDYVWSTYRPYLHVSTAEDFTKLDRLRRPDAVRLGVLLVGFDAKRRRLDKDVGEMFARVGGGWSGHELPSWDEPYYGTRARVWFWTKATQ